MEGRLGRSPADEASQTAYAAAKTMKAKIIAVEAFSVGGSPFIDAYKGFGGDLLGVVINKVPRSQFRHVRAQVESFFKAAGIKLLGIIPENRMLLAVTVGELAENLGGKILNSEAKADELVENYMLGAMVVGSGLDYFGRKERKAAIIRRDRPDMQLAALETSTVCLVLSGGEGPPAPGVLYKAESRGIPVISAGAPTGDIVAVVEETLRKTRVHQTGKLARLAETVGQNIDIKALT
jgi:BioD-like phosphotransacetylase family protein